MAQVAVVVVDIICVGAATAALHAETAHVGIDYFAHTVLVAAFLHRQRAFGVVAFEDYSRMAVVGELRAAVVVIVVGVAFRGGTVPYVVPLPPGLVAACRHAPLRRLVDRTCVWLAVAVECGRCRRHPVEAGIVGAYGSRNIDPLGAPHGIVDRGSRRIAPSGACAVGHGRHFDCRAAECVVAGHAVRLPVAVALENDRHCLDIVGRSAIVDRVFPPLHHHAINAMACEASGAVVCIFIAYAVGCLHGTYAHALLPPDPADERSDGHRVRIAAGIVPCIFCRIGACDG